MNESYETKDLDVLTERIVNVINESALVKELSNIEIRRGDIYLTLKESGIKVLVVVKRTHTDMFMSPTGLRITFSNSKFPLKKYLVPKWVGGIWNFNTEQLITKLGEAIGIGNTYTRKSDLRHSEQAKKDAILTELLSPLTKDGKIVTYHGPVEIDIDIETVWCRWLHLNCTSDMTRFSLSQVKIYDLSREQIVELIKGFGEVVTHVTGGEIPISN